MKSEKKKAGRKPGPTGKELKKHFAIRAYPSKVTLLKQRGMSLQRVVDEAINTALANS
jgi:hypothetical protein